MAQRIEREIGITISVGLGPNKLLAKIASDQDKPRGFFVLGRQDAPEFLADKPVTILWGVGPAMARELAALGILKVGHLRGRSESELKAHFGAFGIRLAKFARGEDDRRVTRDETAKSISAEETLDHDTNTLEVLERELWRLCQKVARKLLRDGLAAGAVSLKLKSADFQLRTRMRSLSRPTRLPEFLYEAAHALLDAEMDGTRYRLIGVGAERLQSEKNADMPDLVDLSRIEAEPDAR